MTAPTKEIDMKYQRFEFLVEEMSEQDAREFLDEIIHKVEAKGLRMGGTVAPVSDAEFEFWNVVRRHARGIWDEVVSVVRSLLD